MLLSNKILFNNHFCIDSSILSFKERFWYHDQEDYVLYQIIKNAKDKSSLSDELHSVSLKNQTWKYFYDFSKQRISLLYPFKKIFKNKSVLEIGVGTGIISRFVAENSKTYVGYEPNFYRFLASSYRLKDLGNSTIYHGGIADVDVYEKNSKYDFVLVVGVLEYSKRIKYLNSLDGEISSEELFLKICSKKLKKNGILILAIENKLGYRYFLPRSEDHTAFYSESIHDFVSDSGIKTFSKSELVNLFNKIGLKSQKFFYLHPDYKSPEVIYTDLVEKYTEYSVAFSQLIYSSDSREFSNKKLQVIDELMLIKNLIYEGVITKFANSFLAFASPKYINIDIDTDNFILKRFNFNRSTNYSHQITVKTEKNNNLLVEKSSILDNLKISSSYLQNKLTLQNYLHFVSLSNNWNNIFVDKLFFLLEKFYDFINSYIKNLKNFLFFKKENLYELTVNNVFVNLNDYSFDWFDREGVEYKVEYDSVQDLVDLIFLRSIYQLSKLPKMFLLFNDLSVKEFLKTIFSKVVYREFEFIYKQFLFNETNYQLLLFNNMLSRDEIYNNFCYYVETSTINNKFNWIQL